MQQLVSRGSVLRAAPNVRTEFRLPTETVMLGVEKRVINSKDDDLLASSCDDVEVSRRFAVQNAPSFVVRVHANPLPGRKEKERNEHERSYPM